MLQNVNSSMPNSGYSSLHGAYAAECQRWAQMAYAPPLTETISLEIRGGTMPQDPWYNNWGKALFPIALNSY